MLYIYKLIINSKAKILVISIALLWPTPAYAQQNCNYAPSTPTASNHRELVEIISPNKAYFYSAPANECSRNDFVIFKDNLVVLDKGKEFSYVVYLDKNSNITNGFIKNENLSNVELASCVNENDFTVNIHDLIFKLNEPTSKVKSDVLSITGQEPSLFYIGQNDDRVTSFALDYKYNNQVFIYLSVLNSDVYNISEETITQMNFTTPNQFTSRGIGIGSHFNDILQQYGHCGVIEKNSGTTSITYSYFDRSLVFTVKENKVIDISYLTLPWDQVRF